MVWPTVITLRSTHCTKIFGFVYSNQLRSVIFVVISKIKSGWPVQKDFMTWSKNSSRTKRRWVTVFKVKFTFCYFELLDIIVNSLNCNSYCTALPCFTSTSNLTQPSLASPHLTSPHLTSPHLTSLSLT